MAFGALDRQTSRSHRMAPSRVPFVLDLEGSTWTTRAAHAFHDYSPSVFAIGLVTEVTGDLADLRLGWTVMKHRRLSIKLLAL